MASVVKNTSSMPALRRGVPVVLGSFVGATDVFQFVLSSRVGETGSNGPEKLWLSVDGAATGTPTPVLEASLDNTRWFSLTGTAGGAPINADTAAGAASFDVSGLPAGAIFRAGLTGAFTGTPALTALLA